MGSNLSSVTSCPTGDSVNIFNLNFFIYEYYLVLWVTIMITLNNSGGT